MSELSPILYVDDEPANLVLFGRFFEDHYDIRTALSARQGMEIVRGEEIHLVITDQRMPEVTGIELLAALYREFPAIPRLLTTAYTDVHTVIEAINEGHVYRYVAKPWDEEALAATFDEALELQGQKRRHRELVDALRREAEREEEIRRIFQAHAPAAVAEELLGGSPADPPEAENPPPPVLYVDDEVSNLTIFRAAFEDDYEIFTAESGADALEILRREEIRLVVADQRMPGMTGVELLETLARERPETVCMILTGYIDIESAILAINDGRVYRYVTKPWNMAEFKAVLDQALASYDEHRRERRLPAELRQRIARESELCRAFEPYVPAEVAAEVSRRRASSAG